MANHTICSIEGCGNKSRYRGWCPAHYNRWRNTGDTNPHKPIRAISTRGAPKIFLNEIAFSYDGFDCLIWPHARNQRGYAIISNNGKCESASRIVCQEMNGNPENGQEAAHSCGNGHLGCVAKNHLSWKTHSENMQDKIIHGTSRRGSENVWAKLDESQVLEIVDLKGSMSRAKIAAKFGVKGTTVQNIHEGKKWGWLTGLSSPAAK